MKKFLDSDCLIAVQFQSNTVPVKKGNTVIYTELSFFGTLVLFSCILLVVRNSNISHAIWKNTLL